MQIVDFATNIVSIYAGIAASTGSSALNHFIRGTAESSNVLQASRTVDSTLRDEFGSHTEAPAGKKNSAVSTPEHMGYAHMILSEPIFRKEKPYSEEERSSSEQAGSGNFTLVVRRADHHTYVSENQVVRLLKQAVFRHG